MNYVKQFDILGVDSRQTSCIELHGAPNAATEGAVGVLGIDVTSPTREVYKCVAVNGGVYTWMPITTIPVVKDGEDGFSFISAVESRSGLSVVTFPFYQLNIPGGYVVKVGDLIVDAEGYIYQITIVTSENCTAKYIGTRLITEYSVSALGVARIAMGQYKGTGTHGASNPNTLSFDFMPRYVRIIHPDDRQIEFFIGAIDGGDTLVVEHAGDRFTRRTDYTVTVNEGTISWYVTFGGTSAAIGSQYQCNTSNSAYYYEVLG